MRNDRLYDPSSRIEHTLDLPPAPRSRIKVIIDAAKGEVAEAAYRRCEDQAATLA